MGHVASALRVSALGPQLLQSGAKPQRVVPVRHLPGVPVNDPHRKSPAGRAVPPPLPPRALTPSPIGVDLTEAATTIVVTAVAPGRDSIVLVNVRTASRPATSLRGLPGVARRGRRTHRTYQVRLTWGTEVLHVCSMEADVELETSFRSGSGRPTPFFTGSAWREWSCITKTMMTRTTIWATWKWLVRRCARTRGSRRRQSAAVALLMGGVHLAVHEWRTRLRRRRLGSWAAGKERDEPLPTHARRPCRITMLPLLISALSTESVIWRSWTRKGRRRKMLYTAATPPTCFDRTGIASAPSPATQSALASSGLSPCSSALCVTRAV